MPTPDLIDADRRVFDTLEAPPAALNWAVAVIAGYDEGWLRRNPANIPDYLNDWSKSGPLTSAAELSVSRYDDFPKWTARTPGGPAATGDTELEARLRALVLKQWGPVFSRPTAELPYTVRDLPR